jgi:hypothetical protein
MHAIDPILYHRQAPSASHPRKVMPIAMVASIQPLPASPLPRKVLILGWQHLRLPPAMRLRTLRIPRIYPTSPLIRLGIRVCKSKVQPHPAMLAEKVEGRKTRIEGGTEVAIVTTQSRPGGTCDQTRRRGGGAQRKRRK